MPQPTGIPPTIPTRWTDPAPILALGTVIWAVVAVLATVVDAWSSVAATCWAGTVLGALGFGLFLLQRRAARSGRRTAQRGLTDPTRP